MRRAVEQPPLSEQRSTLAERLTVAFVRSAKTGGNWGEHGLMLRVEAAYTASDLLDWRCEVPPKPAGRTPRIPEAWGLPPQAMAKKEEPSFPEVGEAGDDA